MSNNLLEGERIWNRIARDNQTIFRDWIEVFRNNGLQIDNIDLSQEMLKVLETSIDQDEQIILYQEVAAVDAFAYGSVFAALLSAKRMTELVDDGHTPKEVINMFCTAFNAFNESLALSTGE